MNKKIKEIIEALEFMGKMGDVSKIAVENLKTGLEELDEQLTMHAVSSTCCVNPHETMRRTGEDMFICNTCGEEHEI